MTTYVMDCRPGQSCHQGIQIDLKEDEETSASKWNFDNHIEEEDWRNKKPLPLKRPKPTTSYYSTSSRTPSTTTTRPKTTTTMTSSQYEDYYRPSLTYVENANRRTQFRPPQTTTSSPFIDFESYQRTTTTAGPSFDRYSSFNRPSYERYPTTTARPNRPDYERYPTKSALYDRYQTKTQNYESNSVHYDPFSFHVKKKKKKQQQKTHYSRLTDSRLNLHEEDMFAEPSIIHTRVYNGQNYYPNYDFNSGNQYYQGQDYNYGGMTDRLGDIPLYEYESGDDDDYEDDAFLGNSYGQRYGWEEPPTDAPKWVSLDSAKPHWPLENERV